MFIYEKNKINSETGKTEQTLNITFEGNKPVENPDVIVTKDGITGIKSDSKAYVGFVNGTSNLSALSSISIDGTVVRPDVFPFAVKQYYGFNIQGNNVITSIYLVSWNGNNYVTNSIMSDYFTDESNTLLGEYVIDFVNQTFENPNGTYTFEEVLGTKVDNIIGVQLGD